MAVFCAHATLKPYQSELAKADISLYYSLLRTEIGYHQKIIICDEFVATPNWIDSFVDLEESQQTYNF